MSERIADDYASIAQYMKKIQREESRLNSPTRWGLFFENRYGEKAWLRIDPSGMVRRSGNPTIFDDEASALEAFKTLNAATKAVVSVVPYVEDKIQTNQ